MDRSQPTGDLQAFTPAISNAAAQNALALAQAMQSTNGTVRIDSPQIEIYDKPTSSLITFKGRNAADDANAAVNAYALNTINYNVSDGYVPTYNDGFSGKNINTHIQNSNGGRGLLLKAITFIATNSGGTQDATVLQALDWNFVGYTVKGGLVIPKPIDIGAAIRNTQFQSGTLTVEFPQGVWINSATQLKAFITSGATVTANLIWA